MTWPQAFAFVGVAASFAAIAWALARMAVRTGGDDVKLSDPPTWRSEKYVPAPQPPRES